MSKRDDLIKYIIQRVVTYIDEPKEQRSERRLERKHQQRELWLVRWFGLLPFSMKMMAGDWKHAGQPVVKRATRIVDRIRRTGKWGKGKTLS
ncbi:YqzE family protein [Paenibacillus sp. UMB4589-SE434]|uniref:YqzE family protein n=1 Tax=Paenibacillus sp. UMB4589-SE434 TaxID=3046314 RepID=UPI00254C1479|nr:YqzE family protein [Paenibacillus sp. UMB4589-SE434]MDK8182567.1 YqzE family protein [Paenibacillus sp. UMB4589-SE434]